MVNYCVLDISKWLKLNISNRQTNQLRRIGWADWCGPKVPYVLDGIEIPHEKRHILGPF